MGAILTLLKAATAESDPIDIPIDFSAKPTTGEADYALISKITAEFPTYIEIMQNYKGSEEAIKLAISKPGKPNEDAAWDAIIPSITKLKQIYEFSLVIEGVFPKVLQFLSKAESPIEAFEKYQASAYQLATIVSFCLEFDLLKMGNPSIQNDFSYYRRTVSRMKINNALQNIVVPEELGNRITMFLAYSNPLMKLLLDCVTSGIKSNTLITAKVVDCFGILSGVSYNAIAREKTQPQGDFLYLRVMVGSIIFYDWIDPHGAFAKTSSINMKSSVKVIKSNGGVIAEPLMNVLKFTSKHLNDLSCPKGVKALFL